MLTLIAGIAENNCIGKNNTLPWHIPEDMAHFKSLTLGKTVLMGRKTWESLPKKFRPLPNRTNIVISRQKNYAVSEGVLLYSTIEAALRSHSNEDLCCIGGAGMYEQTISQANALEITHVHRSVDGDAFFPQIDMALWKEVRREDFEDYSFVRYERK